MTTTSTPSAPTVTTALALLRPFSSRVLPRTVRRIASWKGLSRATCADHLEDLRQELALDCLLNAASIVAQSEPERHLRWMRIAERWIHTQQRHSKRSPGATVEPEELPHHDVPPPDPLPTLPAGLGVLRNGRCNVSGSARGTDTSVHRLRRQVDAIASRLDRDGAQLEFWRNRLGEALTGLAADLLQVRQQVRLLPRARRRPDPAVRIARLRRLHRFIPVARGAIDVRRAMRAWLADRNFDADAPRQLLQHASELRPRASDTWLWLFEACIVDRDLAAAAQALRQARRVAVSADGSLVLARIRLREARRDQHAALALLARSCRRRPDLGQLQQLLQQLRTELSAN